MTARTLRLGTISLLMVLHALPVAANPRALFDASHAENVANANWIIDDNQPVPSPAQSGITWATAENYWQGAISAWGVQLVKRGYTVASLTSAYGITYGNGGNPYDLSNYDVFIIDEPNTRFTAAESTAIFNYVRDGGGLVGIADHNASDRNNDKFDSPRIWNLLDRQFFFGAHFDTTGEPNNNISQSSSNFDTAPDDSIILGAAGTVTAPGLAYHNGTVMVLHPAANPTVRANIWITGNPHDTTNVMVAQGVYGNGRVAFATDSSPADDGTASNGANVFPGWAENAGNDSLIFLNATLWATRRAPDLVAPTVTVTAPNGGETWKVGSSHAITWSAADNIGVTSVDLAYSTDGGASFPNPIATGLGNSGTYAWSIPNTPTGTARVRAIARDAAANSGSDASDANFTIDTWIITASAGPHGTIAPIGAVAVAQGASQGFTITPGGGYAIADVKIDGVSNGAIGSYSFTNVSSNHTIAASFADTLPPAVTVTSPNRGESWQTGSTHSITWTASDGAGVDSISIDFSASGGSGPWAALAHGLSNSGSYAWTISGGATDSAMVRVTAFDSAGLSASDASDSLFQITDPTAGVGNGPRAELALERPIPNPSRGEALLRFSLPHEGSVRLEVADVTGRRVWRSEGERSAGPHLMRWDGRTSEGRSLGAGLYFVRLVTPWGTRSERLVRLN